jgi:predicted ATPase
MPEGVPPSLREVVWSRVRTLGQDVFTVLAAASVLGLEFPEDVLFETLDLPEATVLGALDAAVAAGILIDLRSVRRAMRFVHALVANAMYSEIGPSSRARNARKGCACPDRRMASPSSRHPSSVRSRFARSDLAP